MKWKVEYSKEAKKFIDEQNIWSEVRSGIRKFLQGYSMHRYEVIIYWSEEDNAYIAEVPELPGCMADGATYKEALKNAEVIISEWLKTAKSMRREIPAPKGKLVYA